MNGLRIFKDWAIDDDRLVIWSFEGIGKSAYNGLVEHYNIKEVVINTGKNSVVPDFVFYGCQLIESVVIKDGVASMGDYEFYGCSRLTSVTIPDSVTHIGRGAFCCCSNLKSITIPSQITMNKEQICDYKCEVIIRSKKEVNMTETNNAKKREEVDLYDPKFVHFDWDVSLKGKNVFYSTAIDSLKTYVRANNESHCAEITDLSRYPSWPFLIKGTTWKFVYYDPNYEIKRAYFKENKPIQIRRGSADEWEDLWPWGKSHIEGPEYFDDEYQYRIKPEEEEEKPGVEVNVDVKVNNTSSDDKVKITINGKECVFENAEQARMVLKG